MDYFIWVSIIIGAWFFADFITGIFHWAQDQYLSEERTKIPLLKKIAADNDLHHTSPATMGKRTLWENTTSSIWVSLPVFAICWFVSAPIVIWLGIFFGIFANAIHSFNHKPRSRVPEWIKILQSAGIFQSQIHHSRHHYLNRKKIMKEDTTEKYCVMTDFLNSILDAIKFFPVLERMLALCGLVSHRIRKIERRHV